MRLDPANCESRDQAAYIQAITTEVQIELETLCYHSCPFVRSRALSRVELSRIPNKAAQDMAPSVLASLAMRKDCPGELFNAIGAQLAVIYDSLKNKKDYAKFKTVWYEYLHILNDRIAEINKKYDK